MCISGNSTSACGINASACLGCGGSETCNNGVCLTACQPQTCQSLGKNCGMAPDGCGGQLTCGTCAVGETCGARGPNVCGVGACTPRSCQDQSKTCGQLSDGCSLILACGSCQAPQTCNASNVCACAPATCASLGKNCGSLPDGCGALLSCGTCTSQQVCGGGGAANVCGVGTCTPLTCAGQARNCGTLADGCGGTLSCGTCALPQSCAGGGVANVCGGCTVTTSCTAQGKNCGSISDGCTGMLSCGTCSGFQTCGGMGTANVCGASCLLTCPTGFACNAQGVCTGGSTSGLVLNVLTPAVITVGGSVTQNGARPISSTPTPCARIYFDNIANDDDVSDYACATSATTPLVFTNVQLFAGTYKVSVADYNDGSSLPAPQQVVNAMMSIPATTTSLVLNVVVPPPVKLSGTVTQNGSRPTASSPTPCARIQFNNLDPAGEDVSDYACATSATTPLAFSMVSIFPGTFEVSVSDYNSGSSLPDTYHVVNPSLVISGAATGVTLNVVTPAVITVGGSVTQNGARPSSSTPTPCARIYFDNVANDDDVSDYACATSATTPLAFTNVQLFAGTYKVSVADYNNGSSLPAPQQVVNAMLSIPASTTTLVLNVVVPPPVKLSGTVTQNGNRPTASSPTPCARILFNNLDPAGEDVSDYACATSATTPLAFSMVSIFPGTYEVSVSDYNFGSSLPDTYHQANAALVVSGAATGLTLNVVTPAVIAVGGSVTQNGARPISSTPTPCARIFFDNVANDDDVSDYACATSATTPLVFTNVQLFAGTYKVSVADYNDGSSLPAPQQLVNAMLSITASTTSLVLNVAVPLPLKISGSVTQNGSRPTASSPTPCARILFNNLDPTGEDVNDYACATSATAPLVFSMVSIFPGTYEVKVSDYNSGSSLPDTYHQVIDRILIP